MARKLDVKKTKVELIDELEDLRVKLKETSRRDPVETKAREIERHQVEAAVEGLTVEEAVQGIAAANIGISKAMSELQEQVGQKAKELETINLAIAAKQEELEELHGKDVVASAIAALIAEFDAKKFELETEQAETERQYADKNTDLERELLVKRQDFEFQLANSKVQQKQRMQEEHRAIQVQFDDQLRAQQLKVRDDTEARERNWQLREETLQKAEAEILNLRAQSAKFPEELAAAVKKAEAIKEGSLKKEYGHETAMLTAKSTSDAALAAQTISTLQGKISDLAMQNEKLRQDNVAANSNITSIANKALEASAGALARDTALSAMSTSGRDGGARAKS